MGAGRPLGDSVRPCFPTPVGPGNGYCGLTAGGAERAGVARYISAPTLGARAKPIRAPRGRTEKLASRLGAGVIHQSRQLELPSSQVICLSNQK
jgi:hypothetical protein